LPFSAASCTDWLVFINIYPYQKRNEARYRFTRLRRKGK
jgi:hypothetical protein